MWRAFVDWLIKGDRLAHKPRNPATEERARLVRQIEILEAGPVNYRDRTPETARLAAELRHALDELDGKNLT